MYKCYLQHWQRASAVSNFISFIIDERRDEGHTISVILLAFFATSFIKKWFQEPFTFIYTIWCLSKSPKEEVEVQWSALVNKKSLADDSNLKRIVSGANIDREIYWQPVL